MKECTRCEVMREDSFFTGKRKKHVYNTCTICRETSKKSYFQKLNGELPARQVLSFDRKEAIKRGNFICASCKKEKPFIEFGTTEAPKNWFHYTCKMCMKLRTRFSKMKTYYGINKTSFIDIFNKQNKSCAICKIALNITDNEKMRSTTLCVDHNHETGKFRGILCNNCNRGIGFLQDNEDILLSAYNYIIAHKKSDKLLENPEEDNQQPI